MEFYVQYMLQFVSEYEWLVRTTAVAMLVILVNFALPLFLYPSVNRHQDSTPSRFNHAIRSALLSPLRFSMWLLGATAGLFWYSRETHQALPSLWLPVQQGLAIFLVGWFMWRLAGKLEVGFTAEIKVDKVMDQTMLHTSFRVLRAVIVMTGVMVLLQTLGVDISVILMILAIGGLALGFAAKDLIANVLGGAILQVDRPFVTGDWIRSPDRDIEGVVEHIGWRMTRIRKFDKRPLYVPNAVFSSIVTENPSRMTSRRIHEHISIRYEDLEVMAGIVQEVKRMLFEHEDIDSRQETIVNFDRFNESSVDFMVSTFTRTLDWVKYHELRQDILLKINDIVARHGAEMAYPTQTMYVNANVKRMKGFSSMVA